MFLLVPAYPGSPGQKAVKRLCVCVCVTCSASRLPKVMAGSSSNDFEAFNKQTDDAWDGGDDDLLLEAFNVRISRRDVQSAATQVICCFY